MQGMQVMQVMQVKQNSPSCRIQLTINTDYNYHQCVSAPGGRLVVKTESNTFLLVILNVSTFHDLSVKLSQWHGDVPGGFKSRVYVFGLFLCPLSRLG